MEAATGAETPNLSAPATPGTPAPLFAGPRVDSLSYDRKSMPRCKCLPVDAWMAPNACVLEIPVPDVSLTRKVRSPLAGSHARAHCALLARRISVGARM
jgi:aquaporin NIP